MATVKKKNRPEIPPEVVSSCLENSMDGICIFSTEGVMEYCNQAQAGMLGYGPGELDGLSIGKLPYLSREQQNRLKGVIRKTVSGESTELIQMPARTKDGRQLQLEVRATTLYDGKKTYGVQLLSRDVGARSGTGKQAEMNGSFIEDFLDGITDPLFIHHFDSGGQPGRIVLCNRMASEVTGYTRAELLRMDVTDLGHPQSGLRDTSLNKELSKGKPVLFERIITRKDKSVLHVEVHAQMIRFRGENLILSLLRDITQRKKAEEETQLHLMFEKIVSNISSRFVNMPDAEIGKGIERTLKEVCDFIGATWGGLCLFSPDMKSISILHEWYTDAELSQIAMLQDFPVTNFEYYYSKLFKLEDIVLDSLEQLPENADGERQWFKKNGFRPIFFVPIVSEDQLTGVLGFAVEDNLNYRWPRQYGYLLRYIANVFYNALNRKDINSKLRLTEFTLNRFSESVFWLSAPDYRVIDVNPAACKSLGYSREELLEMNILDFDLKFTDAMGRKLRKVLKSEKNLTMETIHRKKSGEEFPVEIIANLIEFEGMEYVVSFSRDITARKEAEDQLRKSEQEYRRIFENVANIFFEASLDGKLINITPSVEQITKYKREKMIGQPMEAFYFNPSVRDSLLKELYTKGEILEHELDVKDMDGSAIPCSLNTKIIYDEEGKPERIVGSITDLRRRKLAEKQIRQLSTALQQSPVSVIITDTDTRILYVNDSFSRFSGLKPQELIGKNPFEITRGQVPLKRYTDLWETVRDGNVWKGELEYIKRDAEKVWLSITVSPVFDENDRPINFIAILEEITERKLAEQHLRKAKEEAEKSDHLKSSFLANMSHEIRTPMNAILGFSSLLKEGTLEKEQSDYYIDIINSKGRDLLRIISDIIDISRIEAGDLYIKMEPVEVFPFIREIYREFKEDTQVKSRSNLQFRLNVPEPEKKMIVNTDPSRMKQVFVNLIQNALKFTSDGFVELGFETSDKNEIRFYVRDSGIGIPEDKQKIIFDRFRQIDDSNTREYGGTGLGLAICKNLLELMGTRLSLESVEGQGSEFCFRMKYILTEKPETREKTEEFTGIKTDFDLRGKKIMIVEDDGSSYLFLETFLNRFSPDIVWARTGKQAVELVRKNKDLDLVLMDIRMPEMDGLEATKRIRKTHPSLPIVAQTAYAQVTDRKLALENGCNDYLSKPISPVELTAMLAKYFSGEK